MTGGNIVASWIVKADSNGNMTWIKTFKMDGLLKSVIQTANGGYVAVGAFERQAYIVRTDGSGVLVSSDVYGEVSANVSSCADCVVPTSDGGFVVAGGLNYYSPTTIEGFRVIPPVGNNVWLAKFP